MKKVFEPVEFELTASLADPNRVIEVQIKIKEFLEANVQRQQGIKQELLEEGAWALPGLINATFVWMKNLERDKKSANSISNLMADIARDSPAAQAVLFRSGVMESPFETPRSIACTALETVDWRPSNENLQKIRAEIKSQKRLDNTPFILDLYQILLLGGVDSDLNTAMEDCKRLISQKRKIAGQLLALLIKSFPKMIDRILIEVILSAREFYKDNSIADMLIDPLRPIPIKWWKNDVIVRVTTQVLSQCRPARNRIIQYLWTKAALDYKEQAPHEWGQQAEKLSNEITEFSRDLNLVAITSINQYWFRALGFTGDYQLIIDIALSDADNYTSQAAALQLFFGANNRNIKLREKCTKACKELKYRHANRFAHAKSLYEEIISRTSKKSYDTDSDDEIPNGPGYII